MSSRFPLPLLRDALPPTLLLAALLLPSGAAAGGWTQPAGEGYAKVWFNIVAGDQAFLADGELVPSESFVNQSIGYFLEYGLTDEWTLVSTGVPAGLADYDDESTAYIGPITAGLRRAILTGPFALALEARYGFEPGVGEENLAPDDAPFVYIPAISSQRFDWEVQAGVPLSFGWIALHMGSRWYGDTQYDPVVRGFGQLGVNLPSDLVADVHVSAHLPIDDTTLTNVAGAGQTEYIGIGLGLAWWIADHVGVSLTGEGVAYAESNAGAPSLSLGVELR